MAQPNRKSLPFNGLSWITNLCFLIANLVLSCTNLFAQENNLPSHHAKICIAYHLTQDSWGHGPWKLEQASNLQECAANQAYFGVSTPGRISGPANKIPFLGNCCDLPASDILLDTHLKSKSLCPENYIVTGGHAKAPCPNCDLELRCTKINTNRYQLAASKAAAHWGIGTSATFSFQESVQLKEIEIPIAIRYAIGRTSQTNWHLDGCIGQPPGSLFSGKHSNHCTGMYFQELQYKGLVGDPPQGTPVKMFPDCRFISDIFSPQAECIP